MKKFFLGMVCSIFVTIIAKVIIDNAEDDCDYEDYDIDEFDFSDSENDNNDENISESGLSDRIE